VVNHIGQLINVKHRKVWSIKPDATVYEALELMAKKDIGFLVVLQGGKLMGVLSERDYARKIRLAGRDSSTTQVQDIMSTDVITLCLECTIEDAMQLMTSHRIRHLPVVDKEKVVAVISMRDVMEAYLGRQRETIQFLEEMALDR
jgi:CBS domain-containing protein